MPWVVETSLIVEPHCGQNALEVALILFFDGLHRLVDSLSSVFSDLEQFRHFLIQHAGEDCLRKV